MALANANYAQSQHLGGRLLNYAQITQDPLHLAHAYCALSLNRAMQGHFLAARDYAAACLSLPFPPDHFRGSPFYTLDPVVMCRHWYVVMLIELGYPAQAVAMNQACRARAMDLGDPLNMMISLVSVMLLRAHTHSPSDMYEAAQAAVIYAERQGYQTWTTVGTIFLACALARLGQVSEGLALLEAASSPFRKFVISSDRLSG